MHTEQEEDIYEAVSAHSRGEIVDLGWLGIHLPEEHGGAGAGLSELIVVLDELGRQVAPGPFLSPRCSPPP